MANDFVTLYTRVASELNRTTAALQADIKNAINDAILEGSKTRLWFNEIKGQTFNTVANQEYYSDLRLTEVDVMYWWDGQTRRNVRPISNDDMNLLAVGTITGGQLQRYSIYGDQFRLWPIPSAAGVPVYVDGFGVLSPFPLVNDADTNAWTTVGQGEAYTRAKAKSIFLRDKVRDFGTSAVYDAIAEDRLSDLMERSTLKAQTGTTKATQF